MDDIVDHCRYAWNAPVDRARNVRHFTLGIKEPIQEVEMREQRLGLVKRFALAAPPALPPFARFGALPLVSSISPMAILPTITAAPITSAGRFSPLGLLGTVFPSFLAGLPGRFGSIVVRFQGKAIVIGLMSVPTVIAFENIERHYAISHVCPTGSAIEAAWSFCHALNNKRLPLAKPPASRG